MLPAALISRPAAPAERMHALDLLRGWAMFGVRWAILNEGNLQSPETRNADLVCRPPVLCARGEAVRSAGNLARPDSLQDSIRRSVKPGTIPVPFDVVLNPTPRVPSGRRRRRHAPAPSPITCRGSTSSGTPGRARARPALGRMFPGIAPPPANVPGHRAPCGTTGKSGVARAAR